MKNKAARIMTFILGINFALMLLFALSCCKSSEKGTEDAGEAVADGGRPACMLEALARGKKENKIVVIEMFDKKCEYSLMMQGTLRAEPVLKVLSGMVHQKVTIEDKGVVEEFGLMESPTFLVFKPDGEFMDPFVQGFRTPPTFMAEVKNYERRLKGEKELNVPTDNHPDFGKG